MTEISAKTLEIAYSAVKMQRMRADMGNLWAKDPEIREMFITIETTLKDAYKTAKADAEARSRQEELLGNV